MKILIRENNLFSAFSFYMNNLDLYEEETDNDIFLSKDEEDSFAVLRFRKKTNTLFISHDFGDSITTFFSLGKELFIEYLVEYFESRYGVKVKSYNITQYRGYLVVK